MSGRWRWAVVGLILVVDRPAFAREPDDAPELVGRLNASLAAIETVQGTHRTYFSPKTPGDQIDRTRWPSRPPCDRRSRRPDPLFQVRPGLAGHPHREAIDGRWGSSMKTG